MRKHYFMLALLAALLPFSVGAQALSEYTVSVSQTEYTSIATTGTRLNGVYGDNYTETFAMPFDFPFGETVIAQGTNITVRADGHIALNGTTSRDYADYNWETGDYYSIIPFHAHDGYMSSGSSAAYWAMEEDETGGQVLVIEFVNVQKYVSSSGDASTSWNYQIRLYPNGNVSTTYGTMTGTSDYANFWMQGQPLSTERVLLTGSWSNPVAASPESISYLTGTPTSGTVITYAPPTITCPRPYLLTVSDITDNGATLTWTPRGGENEWIVYLDGEEVETVYSAEYTFSNLVANTGYTAGVSAVCGTDNLSSLATIGFRTPCVLLTQDDLPLVENFDSYTSGSGNAISPCWTTFTQYSSGYPYPYSSTRHGNSGNSLYFYSGSSQYNYAVLPPVDDLNGLMVNFWTYIGSPASSQLQVGTMTDPNDASTFTAFYTTPTNLTSSTWTEHEATVPEGTTAQYIAFRNQGSAYYTIYLDDVTLMVAPSCARPVSVSVSNVTTTTADVTVNDPTEVNNYRITWGEESLDITSATTTIDVEPGVIYTLTAASICSEDNTVTNTVSTTFITPCESWIADDLPYTDNFDSYSTSAGTTFNPCFVSNGPYPSTSYAASSPNALYFPSGSSSNRSLISFNPIDEDVAINTLEVAFQARVGYSYSYHTYTLEVGVMTDANNASTFSPVATFTNITTSFADFEAPLASYAGEGNVIAIRYYGDASLYLDDLTIGVASSCARPATVAVDSIGGAYARVSWAATTASAYEVDYYPTGDAESLETVSGLDGTVTTLSGLMPNTDYTVSVYAVCEGERSNARTATFRTGCLDVAIADMPYEEGFENMNASSLDPCWMRMYWNTSSIVNNNYPYASSSEAHTGSKSLYFYADYYDYYDFLTATASPLAATASPLTANYSYYDYFSMALMPQFEAPVQNLTLRFWFKTTASQQNLGVGIASDNADTSTFSRVMTIVPTDQDWHEYEVEFSNYSGAPGRIAFLFTYDGYYAYYNSGYIDDIRVELQGDCRRPATVSASDVSDEQISIAWTDLDEESGSYRVRWTDGTTADSADVSTNMTYTIPGLTANTDYTIGVSKLCDGTYTDYRTISVRTACSAMNVPYEMDFEGYTANSSSSLNIDCWTLASEHVSSYGSHYPSINTYTYASGSQALYFYTYTGYAQQCVALPLFTADVNTLMIGMNVRTTSSSMGVEVGVMDSPTDLSTFTTVQTLTPSATSTWEYLDVSLASYAGTGRYIALRPSGTDGSLYIDDVNVGVQVSCVRPASISVSGVSDYEATVNIDDPTEVNSYMVYYTDGTTTDSVSSTSTTVALSNLSGNTAYTVRVYSLCDDGNRTAATTASFRTECGSQPVPYSYNFDDLSSTYNEVEVPCYQHLGSGYVTGESNYAYTGSGRSLKFYPSGQTGANILVLPVFEQPTNLLKVSMMTRPEGDNSGTFSVGYITDLTDITTFVAVETVTSSIGTTYTSLTVSMADAPAGALIAMSYTPNASYTNWFWYVDDLNVTLNDGEQPQPVCQRPTNLRTTSVTSTSATLDWSSTASAWAVSVNGGTEEEVSAHPYTIESLTPGTQYTVRVKALCDDDSESSWATVSFTTSQSDGIDDATLANVRLYPNPATSSVSVEFEGVAAVSLLDLSGREVMSAKADSRATFDVSSLAKGAYFVRVTSAAGTAVSKLVVK